MCRIVEILSSSLRPTKVSRTGFALFKRTADTMYTVDLFLDVLKTIATSADKSLRLRLLLSDRFDAENPLQLFFHGAHLFLGLPFKSGTVKDPYPKEDDDFSASLAGFRSWEELLVAYDSWSRDLPRSDRYKDWRSLIDVFELGGQAFAEQILGFRAVLKETVVPETQPAKLTMTIPHQVSTSINICCSRLSRSLTTELDYRSKG